MAHPFEITQEVEVEATAPQVWEAIATGPGLDSWFMGRNEIEPREGGRIGFSTAGFTEEATVTAWQPPTRFVSTGTPGPDGAFHQFEYRIEERAPGRSAIRFRHTGMLGEDWEAEYEGMSEGDPMYFDKLVQYLTHFQGRFATSVEAMGPDVASREDAMRTFRRGLGLGEDAGLGERARVAPQGLTPDEGVVDYVSPSFLGVRSSDALYRFIYGFTGTVLVGHHLFAEGVDRQAAQQAWASWLDRLFGPGAD
jgi:uncharacterized protein YndB with AHSA1/START domain